MTRTESNDLFESYARASLADREQIRRTLALIFAELPAANVTSTERAELLARLDRLDAVSETGAA